MFGLSSFRGRQANSALDLRAEVLYDYRHPIDLLPCFNAAGLPLAALLIVLDAGCAPVKMSGVTPDLHAADHQTLFKAGSV
jgi:hypothetical protein